MGCLQQKWYKKTGYLLNKNVRLREPYGHQPIWKEWNYLNSVPRDSIPFDEIQSVRVIGITENHYHCVIKFFDLNKRPMLCWIHDVWILGPE